MEVKELLLKVSQKLFTIRCSVLKISSWSVQTASLHLENALISTLFLSLIPPKKTNGDNMIDKVWEERNLRIEKMIAGTRLELHNLE